MKGYPYPYPWKELPGTAEEKAFLDARFAKMSIRERYLVEGASQFDSIKTAADLINLTEQLDNFCFYYGANNDEKLGKHIATYEYHVTPDQLRFLDLNAWGSGIREQNGGVFVSGGYVEQHYSCQEVYTGENLFQISGENASMRIKVASASQPTGLWIRLPDHEISTGEPDELSVAMSELGMITPGGYVYLTPEKARLLLSGQSVKAHPGCPDCFKEISAEELLSQEVCEAAFSEGAWHILSNYIREPEQEQTVSDQGVTMC